METGPNNGLMDPELVNFILKGPHYTGNSMNPKKNTRINPFHYTRKKPQRSSHKTDLVDLQGFNNPALLVCAPDIPETDLSVIRAREQMAFFGRAP